MPSTSSIYQLDPFLDKDGVLREGERLVKSNLSHKLNIKKNKLYGPFLWIGFNCLKATEPLRGDRLLFNVQFPGILGIQLTNLRIMKG